MIQKRSSTKKPQSSYGIGQVFAAVLVAGVARNRQQDKEPIVFAMASIPLSGVSLLPDVPVTAAPDDYTTWDSTARWNQRVPGGICNGGHG